MGGGGGIPEDSERESLCAPPNQLPRKKEIRRHTQAQQLRAAGRGTITSLSLSPTTAPAAKMKPVLNGQIASWYPTSFRRDAQNMTRSPWCLSGDHTAKVRLVIYFVADSIQTDRGRISGYWRILQDGRVSLRVRGGARGERSACLFGACTRTSVAEGPTADSSTPLQFILSKARKRSAPQLALNYCGLPPLQTVVSTSVGGLLLIYERDLFTCGYPNRDIMSRARLKCRGGAAELLKVGPGSWRQNDNNR